MRKEKKNMIPRKNGHAALRIGATGALMSLLIGIGVGGVECVAERGAKDAPFSIEEASYIAPVSRNMLDLSENGGIERIVKRPYNLPGIPSRSLNFYQRLSVRYGGEVLSEVGAIINGITYVPLEATVNAALRATVGYNSKTRTATVSADGLYMSASDGGYVIYANDRPLFSFSPTIHMNNGKTYVPASALTKALGLSFTVSGGSINISGSYRPLTPASRYYREDEVYWLSKIISAESSGESLLGQIAVGDVILNRVKSPLYPNTIYGVIFDRKYGVQFSPTADGRIYANPTYTATLAAKICLEGISLSDDAMYFLNPRAAESNWIVRNREYAYTIGNHDFYK